MKEALLMALEALAGVEGFPVGKSTIGVSLQPVLDAGCTRLKMISKDNI